VLLPPALHAQEAGTKPWFELSAAAYPSLGVREFGAGDTVITNAPPPAVNDSTVYDTYGHLLNDNPLYTPRKPLWRPALGVLEDNTFTSLLDTYVLNVGFTRVGFESWAKNLHAGFPWGPTWQWDTDRFGENFFLHPYGGSEFFNSARANGYDYYESTGFTFFGSYMWKIFGETGVPERNDLFLTTAGGAVLGEVSYRISSYFLDDRTTGAERFFREAFAGIIDPVREFNRLLDGYMFRLTSEEVYQKEPLNLTFAAGEHWVNDGRSFATGPPSDMLTLQLDYGNPFEVRSRKAFDYFKLRADLTVGAGRKVVDNVMGYGILFGSNVAQGNGDFLFGVFQHYDYWDNKTFEMGTIAFGVGMVSRIHLGTANNLMVEAHIAGVPFAGSSTQLGPDTSQVRDYNFGGGAEAKCETSLNFGSLATFTVRGYYYWINTYVGFPGNNFVGILKPSIAFRVFDGFSLGFEQLVYYDDRYQGDGSAYHEVRTEQKLYVQFNIDNFKPKRQTATP
jgi:hypothetical protein